MTALMSFSVASTCHFRARSSNLCERHHGTTALIRLKRFTPLTPQNRDDDGLGFPLRHQGQRLIVGQPLPYAPWGVSQVAVGHPICLGRRCERGWPRGGQPSSFWSCSLSVAILATILLRLVATASQVNRQRDRWRAPARQDIPAPPRVIRRLVLYAATNLAYRSSRYSRFGLKTCARGCDQLAVQRLLAHIEAWAHLVLPRCPLAHAPGILDRSLEYWRRTPNDGSCKARDHWAPLAARARLDLQEYALHQSMTHALGDTSRNDNHTRPTPVHGICVDEPAAWPQSYDTVARSPAEGSQYGADLAPIPEIL